MYMLHAPDFLGYEGAVEMAKDYPDDKHQLLEVLTAYLHGRRPNIPSHSVCMECKLRGTVCVLVRGAAACLGPVTHAGCGAICPATIAAATAASARRRRQIRCR